MQLGIGQGALGIRERDLLAETACHIGIEEIDGSVVRPAFQNVFEH
jgi:hypothetical protein